MPDNKQIEDLMREIQQLRLSVDRLETALPRNDLGLPDADGHRQYHASKIKQASEIKGYQTAITQKILLGLVGVVMAALTSGFWGQIVDNINFIKQ